MGGNLWLPGEVGILRGCKRDPKISPKKHGFLKSLTGLRLSWPVIIGITRFQLESRPEWPIHSILLNSTFRVAPTSASSVKSRSKDGSSPARSGSRELALGEGRLRVTRRVQDLGEYLP
ncbi:hypothetical protein ASPTUDRAFT_59548 [Aspergillus tubingensis CBS 134.48]|uniref:Uncharacterized protein n=1 Tax=Aspergillus tubingensis (strain CBS 134.48) TaxID=767770 RepID=A0A1L9MQZ9_ASPTC|nr:hypothetical protein ASPTUDRAFT_59548 [Aspergillus tubingensis CBS 134.48]